MTHNRGARRERDGGIALAVDATGNFEDRPAMSGPPRPLPHRQRIRRRLLMTKSFTTEDRRSRRREHKSKNRTKAHFQATC